MIQFPKDPDEFIKRYSIKDEYKVYTDGSDLIPVFRVNQMLNLYYQKRKNDDNYKSSESDSKLSFWDILKEEISKVQESTKNEDNKTKEMTIEEIKKKYNFDSNENHIKPEVSSHPCPSCSETLSVYLSAITEGKCGIEVNRYTEVGLVSSYTYDKCKCHTCGYVWQVLVKYNGNDV